MLLGTTVIFWVTPLSYFCLKHRYSIWQIISIFIGFAGATLVFVADGVGNSRWVGNLLALCSAISYSIANVLQESLVYSAPVSLYLCRFSIISTPLSGTLSGIFEHKKIQNYDWQAKSFVMIFSYSILLAVYYTCIPLVMQFSNATEMNISLLSSNFFSLLISILWFGQKAQWLYLVGFIFIPISIVMYTLLPYKEKNLNSEAMDQNASEKSFTNSENVEMNEKHLISSDEEENNV
ncbi:Integral membrane protein [Histomonas meleagridis]|uniref:Integral membrane protein n=1 Tax=Histomonas meleagridis TaxID=135588 RepID=UPI0035599999|nr:Integral membrane protein [Histomonas meleagridis]KAH0800084.1 Integral membrane protein [Histomonas meleagridis]